MPMRKMVKERTIAAYNEHAKEYSDKFKTFMSDRDEFDRFLKYLNGKRILDLGCGAGDHSIYFKNKGYDVTSIDLSEEMVKLCKEKGIDALVMDIEDLKLEGPYDGIWSVTSLIHIPRENIPNVVSNLHNLLTDDGIFYLCVKEGEGERWVGDRYFVYWQEDEMNFDNFELLEREKITKRNRTFLQAFFKAS